MASQELTIKFDGNTPEGLRTINFEPEFTKLKANEYNIAVFDASNNPAVGTVPGMVNLMAFSPGSDRAETTANQVDLSSGNRKFRLFIATINRAVFSVDGLTPGFSVQVTAIRGEP